MADDDSSLSSFINANEEILRLVLHCERITHKAVCAGKILCPNAKCVAERAFFEENGIDHHFRVKHKREFTSSDRNESTRIARELHEKETRECMEKIFQYRKTIVRTLLFIY